ncbi:DNA translocase FtsK [Sansalvadorimonas verongulae]|uniref:DNA translocase FtsK n=1 Tax=Sansalvadorimonas verongulae TaxID=2172824 RepID=UPI0012BC1BFD|nr:DNA translocase FtsK [Sansalvadorimonas verongulae]MTI13809.1 hypothetical protein [Sansalvadorimonas verongulae]
MSNEALAAIDVAETTMLGDLIKVVVDEMKAMPDVWQKLPEVQQQEVIDRVQKQCQSAVVQAVHIIASQDRATLNATVDTVTFKDGVKAVLKMPGNTPGRHDLADAEGEIVMIVIPETEAYLGGETPEADPDQGFMDFESGTSDPLYQDAVSFVMESGKASISAIQRHLKTGYNRSAHMVDAMEATGVVSAASKDGTRTVLARSEGQIYRHTCDACGWKESSTIEEELKAMVASHDAIDCPGTMNPDEEDASQFQD